MLSLEYLITCNVLLFSLTGYESNFDKYNSNYVTEFGYTYDYDSVMHYGRKAFSVDGYDTITPYVSYVRTSSGYWYLIFGRHQGTAAHPAHN